MTDCYCDRNNIGVPGVSCGDCPERDYKKSRDKVKSIGLLCAELKAKGEYEAAECIDRLANANADLVDENAELLEALEKISDTCACKKTIAIADKALAKVYGETE